MSRGEALEIGVGHWSMQSSYIRPGSHTSLYREAAAHARRAEELGYDSFWLGEHHLSYDGYCPSLVPAAAYLAAATDRIKLSASIMILPFHNAHRVAESCAAFQSLAPGRLRLAMGLGYRQEEFLAAGHAVRDRVKLAEEHLDDLRGPERDRLADTEIWMGVSTTGAPIRRAGRYGLGLVLTPNVTPDTFPHYRDEWRAALSAGSRRTEPKLYVIKDIWVDDDPERLEWIRGRVTEVWRHYALFFVTGSPRDGDSSKVDWNAPDMQARDAAARQTADRTIYGTPEHVVEALSPYVEAGADGIIFRMQFGGIGGEALERSLEMAAKHVAPALRELRM